MSASRKSRSRSRGTVTLWKRNATDTNRGRSVVVSDSDVVESVGFEYNGGGDDRRITLTLRDSFDTGSRFALKLSVEQWELVVERVEKMRGNR